MNNAIYAAASGMLTRSNAMDIVGNNLANAGTAGFKKDRMLTSDFGSQLTYNFNGDATQIGSTNNGATSAGIYTTYEQGTFEVTGNSLDLALKGEGFFTLKQPNGNTVLSRDGRFSVDGDGFLVNSAGSFVMGKKGKIKADASDFKVNGDGEIFINNQLSDKLLITVPQNNNNLRKLSDGQISNAANGGQFTGSVMQGAIENSNVDVSEEMIDMIVQSRSYQACSQIIKQMDKIEEKTVTEIGRL